MSKRAQATKKNVAILPLVAHQFCDLVPGSMSEDEHLALVEDVKANGVRQPVMLYQGKILDGRARYRAATAAQVDCPTEDLQGFTDEDARQYVLSVNLQRRTLSGIQKAFAVAELYKRAVNTDGPKPSQDVLAKRYGVSKQSLSLCIKAIEKNNSMLLTRLRRGEVTRGELEEEFYDRDTANRSTATSGNVDDSDDLTGGAVPLPSNVVPLDAVTSRKPSGSSVVGTRPAHPERRAKETPVSNAVAQFKSLSEEDRCQFVQLAWPWLELAVEAHKVMLASTSKAAKSSATATAAPKRKRATA